MPAGFKYDLKSIEANMPEMCRYETVYRYSGGFNLVLNILAGYGCFRVGCHGLTVRFGT